MGFTISEGESINILASRYLTTNGEYLNLLRDRYLNLMIPSMTKKTIEALKLNRTKLNSLRGLYDESIIGYMSDRYKRLIEHQLAFIEALISLIDSQWYYHVDKVIKQIRELEAIPEEE